MAGPLAAGPGSKGHAKPVLEPLITFVREFWSFIRVRKKYWLIPILLVMAVLGVLIVLAKGSVVAPFIYTLF